MVQLAGGTTHGGSAGDPDVRPVVLPELGPGTPSRSDEPIDRLSRVNIRLTAESSRSTMSVARLFTLREGDVVPLDHRPDGPVEVRANGCLLGRGDLLVLGGRLAVRIDDLVEE